MTARILADSIAHGHRLTTVEVTFPRFLLAQVNTHRMLSKNTASTRAIPVGRRAREVRTNPVYPAEWGRNQSGMVAGAELDDTGLARSVWHGGVVDAVARAMTLADMGLHKQHAGRLLEPFARVTGIISATDWQNFINLRTDAYAQPEFQILAGEIRDAMAASTPRELRAGEWHLPLHRPEEDGDIAPADLPYVCAGRCARVSYLTHDGRRDPAADLALARGLVENGHMSPLEHVATPFTAREWGMIEDTRDVARGWWTTDPAWNRRVEQFCMSMEYNGNLRGWTQLRKLIPGEAVWRGGK